MLRRTPDNRIYSRVATPRERKLKVRFTLRAPAARHVSLAGDFNQWTPATSPLREISPGHWETIVTLVPGRYQYKFVVDGQWMHDPTAAQNVPNQFGSLNSVVEVADPSPAA